MAMVVGMGIVDDGERYWHGADPVLGIEDVDVVAVLVPTTVYKWRNRDQSGVEGLLFPNHHFIAAAPSTTGQVVKGLDDDGFPFEAVITWDGARPTSGHTKGELLGDYAMTGQYASEHVTRPINIPVERMYAHKTIALTGWADPEFDEGECGQDAGDGVGHLRGLGRHPL
jgi:hypothetical protein